MMKSKKLLGLIQDEVGTLSISESTISEFDRNSVEYDVILVLLEDIAHSTQSRIAVDYNDSRFTVSIESVDEDKRKSAILDTQKFLEDVGFNVESISEATDQLTNIYLKV